MMGGVQPDQAGRLSYWDFTAMRHHWQERHKKPDELDGEPVEAPSEEFVRQRQAELSELGISGSES